MTSVAAASVEPAVCASRSMSSLAHFGFLTLPNFSMIAFSSAVEVLRMANYVGRAEQYTWSIYSPDGAPVRASNGIAVHPTRAVDVAQLPDVMIVCGGTGIRDVVDHRLCGLLTSIAERGIPLGGICTGAYALMSSQLLDGYRCSVHWENRSALQEAFPHVRFVDELFAIDGDRLTCTGGTAPIDMMLNLVGLRFGQRMSAQVAEQFILERIRGTADIQPIPVDVRVGFLRTELIEVLRLMEANIEEPLSLEELTRLVNLSQRHLQRMFRFYLNVSPTHYYLTLRLKRARDLLRTTNASIARVTTICGFHSQCHFSKAYRTQFGYAPSHERRIPD
ncbi:GlxA family transcriptional regulator [Ralstonia pseudosolanacearum]|uniref:Probable transcriptional regulator transcription regulator protein n=1 Tax=Ralstonia nicotianae (strain ATCC BAA-1114 / GMI1000) TaxID=267608 RepID=Q8XTN8_RALN1|nr:GlxA family transcriptional regulator [Ralstonia pseudosolanacearum]AKZ28156.1 AraC family transcriptional regulator [Ralstonia solanacearum]AST29155.1 AraC family transcriptional regulator [Ralstonia pseudosolanacearum]MDC6285417.1 GlxA family transcriptional regulator [Ralstonia pseudosolanacearum]CAD17219.1 probable transcriptional regulator transcription regulator protein [Ralstonia pseudosolanacearum GMI1000]BCL93877.1 AraC family transcriptional regulator [Ralstonia solanacearum]